MGDQVKRKSLDELLAQADKHEDTKATIAEAKEVLEHVFRAILTLPDFTLADGRKAQFKPYVPPEVTKDGEIQCGFDVQLDDGHLEFMVRNTGHGKSFINMVTKDKDAKGKGRGTG